MIYCDLREKHDDYAIYFYGSDPSKLNGEIEIKSDLSVRIIRPTDSNLNMWIGKLIVKYKNDFNKSIFRKKIAYEC